MRYNCRVQPQPQPEGTGRTDLVQRFHDELVARMRAQQAAGLPAQIDPAVLTSPEVSIRLVREFLR